MDKTTQLLGALLAAQLLVALWAFSGSNDLSAQPPEAPLLAFDPDRVTDVRIEGPAGAAVDLHKEGGHWTLPDAWQAPARETSVTQLLERLHGLKKGLAVGTTPDAQQRFEVAEEKFQRRITLSAGEETLATLYLGTSPGLRRIHARGADDTRVYAVAFAAYEAPDRADDWLDGGLLQSDPAQLTEIAFDGLTLTRGGGEKTDGNAAAAGWQASGLTVGETLDQEKVTELARGLAQLEVGKVLGNEEKATYRQKAPELRVRMKRSGEEPVSWTFSKPEQGDDHVLKTSDHPWYFEVPGWSAEPLLEAAKRDALIVAPKPAAEKGGDSGAAPGGDTPEKTDR